MVLEIKVHNYYTEANALLHNKKADLTMGWEVASNNMEQWTAIFNILIGFKYVQPAMYDMMDLVSSTYQVGARIQAHAIF